MTTFPGPNLESKGICNFSEKGYKRAKTNVKKAKKGQNILKIWAEMYKI